MRIKQNEIKQNKISNVLIICFPQLQHIFKRETMFFCLWFLKLGKSNISTVNCIVQRQPSRGVLGEGVLKICSKFTGEHPCRKVISIKLLCNFIKITLRHGCSPVNLLLIFRTLFLKNISRRQLSNCCDQLRYKFS